MSELLHATARIVRAGARGLAPALLLTLQPAGGTLAQEPAALRIAARARSFQPGEVVKLEVECGCRPSGEPGTARVFDREVPLVPVPGAAAWSALIGLDVELAPGTYPVAVSVNPLNEGPATGIYTLRVATKRFPTRRLRVAPAFVDPPVESEQRIVAENDRLDAVFKKTTWRESVGPFQAPVTATGRNTFGARSIFNGRPRQPHGGVDFGSPIGAPVVAPAPAVVALAEDLYFTGRTVILDHGQGLYSVLAHLSSIAVAAGDPVERGAVVGEVGATGRVTGPHLHWGTRLQGARVDPLSLLAVLPPTHD